MQWRYDSPEMGVLDADEAELICMAQIADFLSLPARVAAPPVSYTHLTLPTTPYV